ncbi:MAG: heparinase II/III family protein [Phycisphaerae bacterium]|nr:heparinase II/III family protein [Phycisphaerae bacterium]
MKTKSVSLQITPPSESSKPQKAVTVPLRKHPRLLFSAADEKRVKKLAKTDKFLAGLIVQLKKNAERMLTEPVLEYKPNLRGKRKFPILLGVSRRCLARVSTLAMAYRLTGDRRFFERARQELLATAAFKDWNPPHFLDTGEMCCAMAIGYDWLFDTLSEKDRATIRQAIVEKGLNRGMDAYLGKEKWGWWSKAKNNWNLVCNGGLVMGALAIAEDEPKLAGEIISHALRSSRGGLSSYKPDGAWFEGPGYWAYGTTFGVLLLASLESALGEDFGIAETPGLDKTGFYTVHTHCPNIKRQFNYGDGGATSSMSPIMFYLSRKYNQPAFAAYECRQLQSIFDKHKVADGGEYKMRYGRPSRLFALEIAWFDERGMNYDYKKLPLDMRFLGRAHLATMRSAWDNKHALYVGFKGGNNELEHGHLDIGSFVLDADDVRWAMDFGADSYNLYGYFDGRVGGIRWKYYRNMTQSHNTIMIGGKNQKVFGKGKIVGFLSTPDRAHTVVDMSNAFREQVKKIMRGVAMLERSAVLVQDEITPLDDSEIRWGMVTPAKIELAGAKAILTKDGRTLEAEILAPAGAKFKIVSTTPPTWKGDDPNKDTRWKENPNKGTSMLAISVKPDGKKLVRIVVLLKPVGRRWKKISTPKIQPLSKWIAQTSK